MINKKKIVIIKNLEVFKDYLPNIIISLILTKKVYNNEKKNCLVFKLKPSAHHFDKLQLRIFFKKLFLVSIVSLRVLKYSSNEVKRTKYNKGIQFKKPISFKKRSFLKFLKVFVEFKEKIDFESIFKEYIPEIFQKSLKEVVEKKK